MGCNARETKKSASRDKLTLGDTAQASTEITVLINGGGGPAVVPVPAAAPLGLLGMGLIAFFRRRKKSSAK